MPSDLDDAVSVRTGVLLVGHGTRSELGLRQCQALADGIAAGLDARRFAAKLAYLEMASPTIEVGIAQLVEKQMERLVVVPLLLFAAGHAKDDIPAAVRSALAAVGALDLPMVQTEPLGLHEQMIELAAARFHDAAHSSIALADTCLLLIGRGSRDPKATAEMQQLGELLHQRLGVGRTQVGFLAMAQPPAAEIIRAAVLSPFRHIVVQPHLLFHGELLDRLRLDLENAAANSPKKAWRVSQTLGEESGCLAQLWLQAIHSGGNSNQGGTANITTW